MLSLNVLLTLVVAGPRLVPMALALVLTPVAPVRLRKQRRALVLTSLALVLS